MTSRVLLCRHVLRCCATTAALYLIVNTHFSCPNSAPGRVPAADVQQPGQLRQRGREPVLPLQDQEQRGHPGAAARRHLHR